MPSNQMQALLECCCGCGAFCPCCPGWPEDASASIAWTSTPETSDCGSFDPAYVTGDFSCTDTEDPIGTSLRSDSTFLFVRVFCQLNGDGSHSWRAQYRSAISGGTFEPPVSSTWADAENFEFICPDCADAVDGQATGTIDFTAYMACETSGGVVQYAVLVHGVVTIGC